MECTVEGEQEKIYKCNRGRGRGRGRKAERIGKEMTMGGDWGGKLWADVKGRNRIQQRIFSIKELFAELARDRLVYPDFSWSSTIFMFPFKTKVPPFQEVLP